MWPTGQLAQPELPVRASDTAIFSSFLDACLSAVATRKEKVRNAGMHRHIFLFVRVPGKKVEPQRNKKEVCLDGRKCLVVKAIYRLTPAFCILWSLTGEKYPEKALYFIWVRSVQAV